MTHEFPDLKSQEEIDQEKGIDWMWIYIKCSFVLSIIISALMVIGLLKWIFFT